MPNFEVRDPIVEQALRDVAQVINPLTPPGYGFVVLLAGLGSKEGVFYIANVQRGDVVKMMQEFIEKVSS